MANIYIAKSNNQTWLTVAAAVVGFWLSASLLLDFVIMPSMYMSGMMTSSGFGIVGYTLFSVFNRMELVCGAATLCAGLWLWQSTMLNKKQKIEVGISSAILLAIAICYTFVLTPQMGGLSVDLHMIDGLSLANGGLEDLQMHSTIPQVPAGMNQMHVIYWGLEALKITLMATVLGLAYRQLIATSTN
jgi:Domain of unknown function (DUF4149)